jgi:hypothetical protein
MPDMRRCEGIPQRADERGEIEKVDGGEKQKMTMKLTKTKTASGRDAYYAFEVSLYIAQLEANLANARCENEKLREAGSNLKEQVEKANPAFANKYGYFHALLAWHEFLDTLKAGDDDDLAG